MSPTRPASTAAAAGHAAQMPAKAPGPLAVRGAHFANVLAETAPLAPKPPAPAMQGPKAQTTALPQAVAAVHAEPEKRARHEAHAGEELDPVARQAAQLAPPATFAPPADREAGAAQTHARVSLEELVPQLVKKIAWSGDAQRGTVRMELGAGDLAGSTLTVSADNGRVSVHVSAPPGTDAAAWKNRIATRLEARGIAVDAVQVE